MLNHCTFFGRLTADPEIRQAGENSVVGKFTIAVERDIPGKDGERGVGFYPLRRLEPTGTVFERLLPERIRYSGLRAAANVPVEGRKWQSPRKS